jgi:hypothetical protein
MLRMRSYLIRSQLNSGVRSQPAAPHVPTSAHTAGFATVHPLSVSCRTPRTWCRGDSPERDGFNLAPAWRHSVMGASGSGRACTRTLH